MAKFKMDKMRGIGTGLLNDVSKAAPIKERTKYIHYNDLKPNPRNKMSMNNIDELAGLIKLAGLKQALTVYQNPDGSYTITTGHRRYAAIGKLIANGDWEENALVECKVEDLDEMDLPLSVADKEMFSILVTNQQREKTDADKLFEVREWKNLITKLREKGIEFIVTGIDENGEEIKQQIAGVNTRDIIAGQLGESTAQIAKYNKVENQGTEELKGAVEDDLININNASDLASLPEEKQIEVVEKARDNNTQITSKDIAVAKKEVSDAKATNGRKERNSNIVSVPDNMVTLRQFKRDIKLIEQYLKTQEPGHQLSEDKYKTYCRNIVSLRELFDLE